MATGWSATENALAAARAGHAAFSFNNRVFVLGGTPDFSTAALNIESAAVDGGGHLGSFSVSASLPQPLNAGRIHFGFAQRHHRLYVVGGADPTGASTAYADVAIGTVNSDGAISWAVGPSLPTALAGCKCAILGDWLYCVGGRSSPAVPAALITSVTGDIALGSISGNSGVITLSAGATFSSTVAAGRVIVIPTTSPLATVADGGALANAGVYVVTGTSTTTVINVTKIRDIAALSITAPVAVTATLVVTTSDVQLRPDLTQANPVLAARIESDGSLRAWVPVPTLFPGAVANFNLTGHVVASGPHSLYVAGGQPQGILGTAFIYRAVADAGAGQNLQWSATAEQAGLSAVRVSAAAVFAGADPGAHNPHQKLVVVGGSSDGTDANALGSVEELALGSDDRITSKPGSQSPLPAAVVDGAVASVGRFLFSFGGVNTSGTVLATVQGAALQDDNAL